MAWESRIKELQRHGDKLFADRHPVVARWQEISDHFYPERGHFTVPADLGEDFAAHLSSSYPLLVRRDLGNAFSAMLRPSSKPWFHLRADSDEDENGEVDLEAREWLERATKVQRAVMYDRESNFVRATKEGDHDFAAFGQCVITVEPDFNKMVLLYRCWHLKDIAWCDNSNGIIDTVYHKWEPYGRELMRWAKGNVSPQAQRKIEKDPYCKIQVRHALVPSDGYDYPGGKFKRDLPFLHVTYEEETGHVISEMPQKRNKYIIPRWQTVSGSQYALSPSTVIALPDARIIQEMAFTLMEAGERAVDPPLIAVGEQIRGDIQRFAGGTTYVEAEYDEKTGEILRPITQDLRGMSFGLEMERDKRAMLAEAFFLNKISMPQTGKEMTAYETAQRVQEYLRGAVPLFEPMEHEYNGQICEATFDLMLDHNFFGPPERIPQSLQGQKTRFVFQSPLHDAWEVEKGQKFLEVKAALAAGIELDPSVRHIIRPSVTMRDVLLGIGSPAKWLNSVEETNALIEKEQQAAEMQQTMMMMQQGADVAATAGEAGKSLQEVMNFDEMGNAQ